MSLPIDPLPSVYSEGYVVVYTLLVSGTCLKVGAALHDGLKGLDSILELAQPHERIADIPEDLKTELGVGEGRRGVKGIRSALLELLVVLLVPS